MGEGGCSRTAAPHHAPIPHGTPTPVSGSRNPPTRSVAPAAPVPNQDRAAPSAQRYGIGARGPLLSPTSSIRPPARTAGSWIVGDLSRPRGEGS